MYAREVQRGAPDVVFHMHERGVKGQQPLQALVVASLGGDVQRSALVFVAFGRELAIRTSGLVNQPCQRGEVADAGCREQLGHGVGRLGRAFPSLSLQNHLRSA